MVSRPLPDFLCIGAQKSGTTWLYENLKAHSGVWLPPEKELHYFDEKASGEHPLRALLARSPAGRRWLRQFRRHAQEWSRAPELPTLRWYLRYFFLTPSDEWYSALFRERAAMLTGELTPAYATLEEDDVARVRALNPDMRLIFLLRNPLERAWSQALMQVRYGYLSEDRAALATYSRSATSFSRSDYLSTIARWGCFFAPEQIFIGFLEDIHFHPEDLLDRICSFLGIAATPQWPHIRGIVHGQRRDSIPMGVAVDLAHVYRDLVARLSERFGGYADWWCFCCERLTTLAAAGEMTLPLYEGTFWDEWAAGAVPPIQSDILSRWSAASS